jgi:PAS domain S-box-containing protein
MKEDITMEKSKTNRELEAKLKETQLRLEEAEETLRAIRNHEVDALVVDGPQGQQVFTLTGAEQPYRTLMETMSEGALTVAADGTILYCNQRFAEILKAPLNRIIGLFFQEIMPSKDWPSFKAALDACAKEGCRGEYHLTTLEGREVPVYVSARALLLQDVESLCIVVTDLTEQRALEHQIRQSQKMQALGTLAGGIAHDFNNLLAAVIGFTELLQEHLPEGNQAHRYAARVLEAGMRGRDLVKHMLTFSRKTEQEKKPLRISSIVKESVKLLRASIPTTISINVNVRSESGLILADPVQIQQVLMNLCTNASYAMRETGGVLDIELGDFSVGPSDANSDDIEPGLYMKLTVRDTGTGIPAHVKDRIFDPFFTTKAVGEGTGLGLSVVMGIVKTMPEMTGVELARRIFAIRPDMPLILCTGFSHLVDAESARAAGIRGFAMKPLTKREIAKSIRKLLDE